MKLLRMLCLAALLPLAVASAITTTQPNGATAQPGAAPAPAAPNSPAPAPPSPPNAGAAPGDMDDIRDIRGPISIPYSWMWAVYMAGGLVLAAALLFLWRWLRRPPVSKPVPPHEIALERLEKARSLMVPERAREYSFAVSEITREYIESRFGERAARRTTEEFLRDLLELANTPLAAHRALLEDFLRYCDLAKFARWQLSDSNMSAMYDSARAFILATRPQPVAAEVKRNDNQTINYQTSTIN